ncbi:MAG: hypothetical protein CEN91_9 [Candidatus Berkelbacteria bacterium Licking1014_85]|uniref:Polymerase nucleotidyl transferase domain-containing protein n=1 Tax=Candidatus Berkelbacteria bacterium Licking1014_85 TaxID=2017148 RepID=A0A554LMW6_9BACT|nr:MAG: hypothetical protein CEN91_9 [Candidatus Berkelbacteria bacterium Licking1014_85]
MSRIFTYADICAKRIPPEASTIIEARDETLRFLGEKRPGVSFVCFGSAQTGYHTIRSDIDICAVSDKPLGEEEIHDLTEELNEIPTIKRWGIPVHLVRSVSRAGDRCGINSSYQFFLQRSPSIYDHFGLLAKQAEGTKQSESYRRLQKEIAQRSKTTLQSRIIDLMGYLRNWQDRIERVEVSCPTCPTHDLQIAKNQYNSEKYFEDWGGIENYPFHVLRKLAGIIKCYNGRDDREAMVEIARTSQVPLLQELFPFIEIFQSFTLWYDDFVRSYAEDSNPITEAEYEYTKQVRVKLDDLIKAENQITDKLLEYHQNKTFAQALLVYDRSKPKNIKLEKIFLNFLRDHRLEKNACQFFWACVKDAVYCDFPCRVYHFEYKGVPVKCRPNLKNLHWSFKDQFRLKIEEVCCFGSVIIDFRGEQISITNDEIYSRTADKQEMSNALTAIYNELKMWFPQDDFIGWQIST